MCFNLGLDFRVLPLGMLSCCFLISRQCSSKSFTSWAVLNLPARGLSRAYGITHRPIFFDKD